MTNKPTYTREDVEACIVWMKPEMWDALGLNGDKARIIRAILQEKLREME